MCRLHRIPDPIQSDQYDLDNIRCKASFESEQERTREVSCLNLFLYSNRLLTQHERPNAKRK